MFKSLALAASALTVVTLAALPAQAGCGHPHGGYGYSSYQSRPSSGYAARLRADRRAEARAAAVRRAKLAAAAKAERVAKAEAAKKADTVAEDTTSKSDTSATVAKVSETRETKVDLATAEPTTCSKFVPALGATVSVACENN